MQVNRVLILESELDTNCKKKTLLQSHEASTQLNTLCNAQKDAKRGHASCIAKRIKKIVCIELKK